MGGKILDLSNPCVMSIINITPDSFWRESRLESDKSIVESVERAVNEGASILDIGGYSSRPGADDVSIDEEIKRITSTLKTIKQHIGEINIPISIDTFRSDVVKAALEIWGAVIVNDISFGEDDDDMFKTISDNSLPYIAMHKRGTPKSMGQLNDYDDIVADILNYFSARIEEMKEFNINDLILDVGFGFAKDAKQNFELVKRYDEFSVLPFPTLAGISRKRMIWQTLDIDISESLNGTSALHWELLRGGASILRVHDTKAASEVIKLYKSVFYGLS